MSRLARRLDRVAARLAPPAPGRMLVAVLDRAQTAAYEAACAAGDAEAAAAVVEAATGERLEPGVALILFTERPDGPQ
jgi:hypothetical protein